MKIREGPSELERAPREVIRAHQWERLQGLVARSRRDNAFYRRKWAGQPCDSWADFERLPLTTKAELAADQEAHPPFGSNISVPLAAFIRIHQTSGSTGRPLRWLDTAETWEWWGRCWTTIYRAAGVGPQDRLFFAFSFGPFIGFWSAFEGSRHLGALAISGAAQTTEERVRLLVDLEATVLLCTPTYALRLGSVARAMGIDLAASCLRLAIQAGEPGAQVPGTRARIEELLGVEVFDHTGMTEVGATGFECQAHPGGTHLNEAEFIFEVLDPSAGRATNGDGELVVTNLGRAAMPVIRYRTGDRIRWNDRPCDCGRSFARMDGGILGRVDDMMTVRGINVFPTALENIVRANSEIQEFKMYVFEREGLTELALEVEAEVQEAAGSAERVRLDVHRLLGLRVEVRGVPPGTLPRAELKARRLVRGRPGWLVG